MTSQDEQLLDDLLLHWEELSEQGVDTSADDLARERPDLVGELARRITVLKAAAWLDKPLNDDSLDGETYPPATAVRSPVARPIGGANPAAESPIRGNPRPGSRWYRMCGLLVLVGVGIAAAILHRLQPTTDDTHASAGTTRELMERAATEFFHARYADADASFSAVLQASPDNHDALVNRGVCRLKLGRMEEAIADFTAALRHSPASHEVLRCRAQAFVYLHHYDDAIADLECVLPISPDREQVRRQLTAIRAARAATRNSGASPDGIPSGADDTSRTPREQPSRQ